MAKNRSHHTAAYLLSHFLNSKESLQYSWLTGSLVSVIRYVYDVIDMNFNQTGQEIFNKSVPQTAAYSRTSKATVKRGFTLFIKHNLLTVVSRQPRRTGVYKVGELLKSRLTMSPELSTPKESGLTMSPSLGSPRAQAWAHHEPVVTSSCNKLSKTEREPLSPLFEPNEESQFLCKDLGLNMATEYESFMNRCKHNKTDYNFQRWMKDSKEYQIRKGSKTSSSPKDEVRSTVKWYVPDEPAKPRVPHLDEDKPRPPIEYRTFKQIKADHEKRLMEQEAQGVQTNGDDDSGTISG